MIYVICIRRGGGYYLYPSECKIDIPQYELVKDNTNPNFFIIPVKSNKHGASLPGFVYPYMLTRNNNELNSIFRQIKKFQPLNKWSLAIKFLPAGVFVREFIRYAARKVIKKFFA